MPVVPETVVVAGRVGSPPPSPDDGWGVVCGACAIAVVETARTALNTLIPNSRLIVVVSEGLDRTSCAPTGHTSMPVGMQLARPLRAIEAMVGLDQRQVNANKGDFGIPTPVH